MAERTVPIGNLGESDAPLTYTVPPSFSFTLMGVRASFDGAGASGAFLPCVQLVSDSGQIMAQTIGSSVASGGSADVTFAPFLRGAEAAAGAAGWQFDTYPQAGTFGYVETTGTLDAPTVAALEARYPAAPAATFNGAETLFLVSGSAAFQVYAPDAGQINLDTDGFGVVNIRSFELFIVCDQVKIQGDQGVVIQATAGSDLDLSADTGLGGNVLMASLPTSAPAGLGRVWNNGGVLNVT
jgi:hypothetical protein